MCDFADDVRHHDVVNRMPLVDLLPLCLDCQCIAWQIYFEHSLRT